MVTNPGGVREMSKERAKALDLAVQQIERQFGKGAIMKLGEESARVQVDSIPTGSIALDAALGIGGVPRGRVIEIYGPESSGKTTLTLSIIAHAQKAGGNAVFIDAEHALDAAYAKKLGVDIENLHVAQPDTGEEALEIAEHLVRSGAIDVIVIDSVAAPFKEAEFDILYNEGISREGELLDLAIERNLVQKSGTWFSFGEERIGQGRENARLWLKEHADAVAELELKLREALGLTRAVAAPAEVAAAADGKGERR